MRYISLFAGIGGFDLALNRLGHICVWANEWDKYAGQIYNKNFRMGGNTKEDICVSIGQEAVYSSGTYLPQTKRPDGCTIHRTYPEVDTRDIRTVPTSEIPDHDILVGGFPCQAFSIAGKRRGFDDTRGTLFFEIARILKDKQPKFLILENVKGLLSHNNGETFRVIVSTLTELGYDLQWQVLNSKNFGVPQNRERVFIVGHLRGESRPEVFPIGTRNTNDDKKRSIIQINKPNHAGYRLYGTKGVSPNLRARDRGDEHSSPRIDDGARIRRLTPLECERLQGFPDGWTEGVSDTQRYKCLGNAVTVNVVYEVAKRL